MGVFCSFVPNPLRRASSEYVMPRLAQPFITCPASKTLLERRPFAEGQLAIPHDQEDGDRCEDPEARYNLHAP